MSVLSDVPHASNGVASPLGDGHWPYMGGMPRPLRFGELAEQKAPPRHWFRPNWLTTAATALAARGGLGKSMLVQHEGTLAASGRPYFGPECQPYKTLIWACEDDHDELWRRQERICEHEGIAMASLKGRLLLEARESCENVLMTEMQRTVAVTPLFEYLRQEVNDLNVDYLWLDNAVHVLLADHDNRSFVTAFVNALNGLVTGRPFGVGIVLHTSRSQGSEFSGSIAWENACRTRLYCSTTPPDQKPADNDEAPADVVYLSRRKANYASRDMVRLRVINGLLVPDQAPGHLNAIASAVLERRAEDVVIAGHRSLQAMGIHPTDGKTSQDYLPGQLVAKRMASGFTRADLAQAMNRLMGRRVFVRGEVSKYSNRAPKMGLILQKQQP